MIVEFAVALAVVSGVHELATPVSAAPALAFASTLGSLIGAPVPGQVGAVEGSVAAIGHVLGLSLSTVVAVLLLRRLRTMLRVLVGLLLARRLVAKQPNWLLPQALASGEVFAGVDDR
jgi:membrane associated rhomboid family serine protease